MEVVCLGCDRLDSHLVTGLLYHDRCNLSAGGGIVEGIRSDIPKGLAMRRHQNIQHRRRSLGYHQRLLLTVASVGHDMAA